MQNVIAYSILTHIVLAVKLLHLTFHFAQFCLALTHNLFALYKPLMCLVQSLTALCIIFLISLFLDHFLEITWIAHAFLGIKIAVGILILDAAIKMIQKMQKKWMPRVFMICAFIIMMLINIFSVRISTVILMLAAGVISLIIFIIQKQTAKGGAGK